MTPSLVLLLCLALALVLALLAAGALRSGALPLNAVRPTPLMTPNESEFLDRLERAALNLRFHAQVAMSALIEPAVPRNDRGRYMRAFGTFSQKRIDYVAQDLRTGQVVALIELDNRMHDRRKDKRRDQLTAAARYRTIRWDSRERPTAAQIALALAVELPGDELAPSSALGPSISGDSQTH